jgi:proteasome lid subunit RPN8/RPN11
MIEVLEEPWHAMVNHAESTYPNECCGAMLGRNRDGSKVVTAAVPLTNTFAGAQADRYQIRPEDLLAADRAARERGLEVIGIFHSHPDCDAYFSETDLKNSCPWYSFVVMSVQSGRFHHANSFLPDIDQTAAETEELIWKKS